MSFSLGNHISSVTTPPKLHRRKPTSLNKPFLQSASISSSSSESESVPSSTISIDNQSNRLVKRRSKAKRYTNRVDRRKGHYQVNPVTLLGSDSDPNRLSSQFDEQLNNLGVLPREPVTTSGSESDSSTSSPSEASFDLSSNQNNNLHLELVNSVEQTKLTIEHDREEDNCSIRPPANHRRLQKARNSSTFWELITDVAKDLDLTLQDLSPDIEIFENNLSDKEDNDECSESSKNVSNIESSGNDSGAAQLASSSSHLQDESWVRERESIAVTCETMQNSNQSEPSSTTNHSSAVDTIRSQASTSDHHDDHDDEYIIEEDEQPRNGGQVCHTELSQHRSRRVSKSKTKATTNINQSNRSKYSNGKTNSNRRSKQQSQRLSHQSSYEYTDKWVSGSVSKRNHSLKSNFDIGSSSFQPFKSPSTNFIDSNASSTSSSPINHKLSKNKITEKDSSISNCSNNNSTFDVVPQSDSLFEQQLISQIKSNFHKTKPTKLSKSNSCIKAPEHESKKMIDHSSCEKLSDSSSSRIPIHVSDMVRNQSLEYFKDSKPKLLHLSSFGHSILVPKSRTQIVTQCNGQKVKKDGSKTFTDSTKILKSSKQRSQCSSTSKELNSVQYCQRNESLFPTKLTSSKLAPASTNNGGKGKRPAPPVPSEASNSNGRCTSKANDFSLFSIKKSEIDLIVLPEGNVDELQDDSQDMNINQSDIELESQKAENNVLTNNGKCLENGLHMSKETKSDVNLKLETLNGNSTENLIPFDTHISDTMNEFYDDDLIGGDESLIVHGLESINMDDRLRLTQQIWYLPHINRATVVHYLQGKAVGVFIVRQSSKPQTLAISVRLPHGHGPHIEHYLIERRNTSKSNCLFRLEGSEHYFSTILNLVTHYSNCCDELPVRLKLVPVLQAATSGQSQLSSLALLGQEFWQSKFVQLKQLPKNSLNTETLEIVNSENISIELDKKKGSPETCLKESEVALSKPKLPPRRHNSNCSVFTDKSSSSAQSNTALDSPPPPPPSTKIKSSSPVIVDSIKLRKEFLKPQHLPPLPPKNETNNFALPLIGESLTKPSTRIELPPPIPPRTKIDGNNSKNSPPPPRPTVSKRSSPTVNNLNDLLSPTSMTESEIIDLVQQQNKIDERVPPLPNKGGIRANYYNHVVSSQDKIIFPSQPSPSPEKKSSPINLSKSDSSNVSNLCDVYTQTESVKTNEQKQKAKQNLEKTNSNISVSTFYMDPIDALVVINQAKSSFIESNSQKRHSDPELSHNVKDTTSTTTHGTEYIGFGSSINSSLGLSLESLLESFRNRFPTASTIDDIKTGSCRSKGNVEQKSNQLPVRHDAGFSTVDSQWFWHDCKKGIRSNVESRELKENKNQCSNGNKMENNFRQIKRDSIAASERSDVTTAEDLIGVQSPEFVVPKITLMNNLDPVISGIVSNGTGFYDNLTKEEMKKAGSFRSEKSVHTDTGTEFSEPWNMEMVESRILSEIGSTSVVGPTASSNGKNFCFEERESQIIDLKTCDSTTQLLNTDIIHFNSYLLNQETPQIDDSLNDDYDNVADDEIYGEYEPNDVHQNFNPHSKVIRRDDSEVTLKEHQNDDSSNKLIMLEIVNRISNYVIDLASRKDNTFAMSIDNFIECTKESTETNPNVILGYIRQFMNGMKNYLLKHGEGEFIQIVKLERSHLKPNQFLNIDSILECTLQKLIIKPLKNHIYELCIRAYNSNGSLKILSHNIKLAQNKSPEELGVSSELLPIDSNVMAEIQQNLRRLQQSYSPIKKLEYLLRSISILNTSCQERINQLNSATNGNSKLQKSLSDQDMLPLLLYVIVHCGVISIEIEIEYMLGLLHSSILNGGDGSYYLTVWSSAIQVLKNMFSLNESNHLVNGNNSKSSGPALKSQSPFSFRKKLIDSGPFSKCKEDSPSFTPKPLANLQAYMKVLIPNELTSSIACKTVPVRSNMTTKEVCRMIAHTYRITNPEDYALYRIKDLDEQQLLDGDYPLTIKNELINRGETPMFAYKRCDAKFIWPTAFPVTP